MNPHYSACFLSAMKFVPNRDKIAIPADTSVESTSVSAEDAAALAQLGEIVKATSAAKAPKTVSREPDAAALLSPVGSSDCLAHH